MIEMSYSDVIKEVAIMIWPGTKRRSELGGIWESKLRNLLGNFFLRDFLRGFLRG